MWVVFLAFPGESWEYIEMCLDFLLPNLYLLTIHCQLHHQPIAFAITLPLKIKWHYDRTQDWSDCLCYHPCSVLTRFINTATLYHLLLTHYIYLRYSKYGCWVCFIHFITRKLKEITNTVYIFIYVFLFFKTSTLALGHTQDSFLGLNQLRHEVEYSSQSSAKIKNEGAIPLLPCMPS